MSDPRTVLITGATDGIGLETARRLVRDGHRVLLHGRSAEKLESLGQSLAVLGEVESFQADLSRLEEVDAMADAVLARQGPLDVLINNAGVFRTAEPITAEGLDVRFVVNTIAPYRLTRRLQDRLGATGRVINLSSAAQAPVNIDALEGGTPLDAMVAYAQSKLAITMWSFALAEEADMPAILAVNPGSLLASKMVREGFGVSGKDIGIGAEVLCRASLDAEFGSHSGEYFDNDSGRFASAHADAMDRVRRQELVRTLDKVIQHLQGGG